MAQGANLTKMCLRVIIIQTFDGRNRKSEFILHMLADGSIKSWIVLPTPLII